MIPGHWLPCTRPGQKPRRCLEGRHLCKVNQLAFKYGSHLLIPLISVNHLRDTHPLPCITCYVLSIAMCLPSVVYCHLARYLSLLVVLWVEPRGDPRVPPLSLFNNSFPLCPFPNLVTSYITTLLVLMTTVSWVHGVSDSMCFLVAHMSKLSPSLIN